MALYEIYIKSDILTRLVSLISFNYQSPFLEDYEIKNHAIYNTSSQQSFNLRW